MERHTFYTDTPWLLLCVALMALVWVFMQLPKQPIPPTPPTPIPPLPVAAPACQQDNNPRPAGTRFTGGDRGQYFAQVVSDPADRRYDRVVTERLMLDDRFDAGSVGPIVFQSDGATFAFIAAYNGQKYILGYSSGSLTPYAAERIQDSWNNWVCFGATGKFLFAVARHNGQWHLDVRPEQANAAFAHYLLNGDPARLELLPVLTNVRGEGQYRPVDAAVQIEVNGWFK